MTTLGFSHQANAALTDGLVAYYPFNGNANDESGNGNNGMVTGAQITNDRNGNSNTAYHFNGSGNKITVQDTTKLNFGTSVFSIGVWVKSTQQGIGKRIVTKRGGTNSGNWYSLAINNNKAWFEIYAQGDLYSTKAINDGNWHFIAVTRDASTKKYSMYIDGVFDTTIQDTGLNLNTTANTPLEIGVWWNESYDSGTFNGVIDELRIYNRALTAAEVSALYQQGTTPTITSITPTKTVIGKPTTFEVRGQNLNANMGFTVGDCAYSNVALAGGTPQLQRFVCTQFGAAGTKQGLIATKPGGTKLHGFKVSALLIPPSTTPMATLTGRVRIGSSIGSNVVLSRSDTVNACLTDALGQFSCPVPAGWTGTLVPQAKGVGFSPALIYVKNAQGKKVLNDALTKFAFNGTPLDSFPANGLMASDWQKLPTDNTKWIISTANGEKNDLRSYEGRFSFRSAPIAANQISAIQTTVKVTQAAAVVFARRVSSNAGHGVLSFYIDATKKASWSGEKAWQTVRFPLTAGMHTLRWEYKKDAGAAKGADAAWIDEVSYPASVRTRVIGTTAKATCVGVTQGTLILMTIKNPTCEQVRAYLAWSKVFRMINLSEADTFVNAINGIEVANEATQNYIEIGGKILDYTKFAYVYATKSVDAVAEEAAGIIISETTGVACELTNSPVTKERCDFAGQAISSAVTYGIAAAAGTTAVVLTPAESVAIGGIYIAKKSFSLGSNLAAAWDAGAATEAINTINISDLFLDEYYKNGMNLTTMRKNYGVTSTSLGMLVDALANKKGYKNSWYGTEYINADVVGIINRVIAKNKALQLLQP
ncbi:LamG domain-containing protein [Crenothrix sp.]|uniref:LamG domain-containing protein n=1 Tax=Crenothrix sp. TaxID=3100433 RepID=UPI00374D51CF